MSTYKKKSTLFETEIGAVVEQALRSMTTDRSYNTTSTYSANTTLYPDNLIPFVDKHMEYLRTHPSMNPRHYIANLRLMTRIR